MEWLLKDTQIEFAILGGEKLVERTKENPDGWKGTVCVLNMTQRGKDVPLKDLINLKCEGQKKGFGSMDPNFTKTEPVPPFMLIIDLNYKTGGSLLWGNKSPMAEINEVSDDHFKIEWERKDIKNMLFIDRRLGTYRWKKTTSKSTMGMEEWGKCEKIDPNLQPKF
jgi:hypothetical protein